ncbi:ATPase, partial [Rhizobium calliandrae]|nr:ATPase [Rhizobium calliandrae]
ETLVAAAPPGTQSNFYRTSAGAEIDLLLTPPGDRPWAIEIKRSLSPKLEKGFYLACGDLNPARRIVVYPGHEVFPMKQDVEAMPLSVLGTALAELA